uniref:Tectonin beta-propeller repeat-containing protein 1 n=1 Tax=Nothobranchius pienaari TaxID=704102 RepID=A0A1A8MKF3_9TELE
MPVSQLWAVDVHGQVYSLSTVGQQWEKCSNAHMEFKRVTASQQCCWGIAFDNSIYLNVHASELPIRYQEETYENQRWNPVDGFSDHLLPSDRWQWSDVTGLQHQPLNGFQLPSHSWDWEDDWYVDENFEGEPTEKEGWTYAMDFPATYTKDKKWNSCVRRRRWLRHRRYKAMDTWAKIPSQQTPFPDPFSDLSCGGWEISEEPRGQLSLWAVSLQGKIRTSVAWAVTKNNKVWFRRGVNSHNPCGSGWISMVGEMIMINVGLNDQVWAISCEDRTVCFRQGVTSSELSGKTWKAISVPRDGERSHSSASANSAQSAGCFFSGEVQDASGVTDVDSDAERGSAEGAFGHVTSTAPDPLGDATFNLSIEAPTPRIPKVTSDSFISELVSDRESGKASRAVGSAIVRRRRRRRPSLWSNVDLEETQIQHGQSAADSSSLSSVATYTFAMEDGADERPLWAWSVQSMSLSMTQSQMAAWRKQIFEQLSERSKRELDNFRHYKQAVEQSVWVKKGAIQWWRDWKPHKWVDVHLALEQFSGAEGYKDGILFIYYNYYDEKKYLHAFINEVTILVPVLNKSKHTFALYTPERTKQRWPIRLAAATELEMHDWLALLSVSCCDSRGVHSPPSKQAIWSTTCKGDVFVSEPSPALEANPYPTPSDQMFWRQVGGHLRLVECNSLGVVWGLGYDHSAWVYTGGYGGGFFQGLASSTDNIYTQTDVKSVYIYENQRWNPVSGYTNRGLPTDRYMWSDVSGLHECTKTGTKPPSPQWTWVSDWSVDYSVSGGTDREGWQYAADFPASYSGYKTIKDFVRRRRWARKCKLTTTGPWQEIPPIPLSDVTILPCVAQSSVDLVPVWAISNKGDVLCRLGVTTLTPAGSAWLHVETDQPFKSISIGAASQVWAIARDGSAFHRGLVLPQKPAGDCWYHIPSPAEQKLKQISVGCTSVYAVDENGNLWYRQGVTPNCPQGSTWEHISNNVRKVSVGPLNQVWIIADKVQGSHSLSRGTVCHRLGVSPMEPKGQSWDYGIGGGWDHITVRANSMEPSHVHPQSASPTPP